MACVAPYTNALHGFLHGWAVGGGPTPPNTVPPSNVNLQAEGAGETETQEPYNLILGATV